jgi:VWFA-related protein
MDLTRDDFQILQDGKPQPITVFSRVGAGPPLASRLDINRPLTREEVRRTIAFVIDDFRFVNAPEFKELDPDPVPPRIMITPDPTGVFGGADDFSPSYRVYRQLRQALERFVERDMREGDLVAILSLARHQGFEQFTADRELLKRLVSGLEFIEWQGLPYEPDAGFRNEMINQMRDISHSTLVSIAAGMQGMPGRKSIVFFSDEIPFPDTLTKLIEAANRSGVTFYPIDPREPTFRPLDVQANGSLVALANATGGRVWGRADDAPGARLENALTDQNSFYVLGYSPAEESFDRRRHKIEVKVTREGLTVRTGRTAFFGEPDNRPQPTRRDSGKELTELLRSPFRETGVRASLSTFFTSEDGKTMLNSSVHIDGRDLRAERNADGKFEGGVDMMAVVVNPNAEFSGHVVRSVRFKVDQAEWERAQQTGLVYRIPHPSEKPGPYQARLAVRDIVSGAMGSSSTYLVVPDVKKGKLALSSLVLSSAAPEAKPNPLSSLAARTFRSGTDIAWVVEVYNAKADKKRKDPFRLQSGVRVFREGKLIEETPLVETPGRNIEGRKELVARGVIHAGRFEPGEYVVQILVRDENAGKTQPSGLADFRIIP